MAKPLKWAPIHLHLEGENLSAFCECGCLLGTLRPIVQQKTKDETYMPHLLTKPVLRLWLHAMQLQNWFPAASNFLALPSCANPLLPGQNALVSVGRFPACCAVKNTVRFGRPRTRNPDPHRPQHLGKAPQALIGQIDGG